jgi:hypothetical protein
LDGLFRWNSDRESAAVANVRMESPVTYSGPLKNSINKLVQEVLGRDIFSGYQPPRKYTGITVVVSKFLKIYSQQKPFNI